MISIILCTHNRSHFLPGCLQSLIEQKNNRDYEIVAVDNASKDNTWEILTEIKRKNGNCPLTILQENRLGKSYALNTALQKSSGDIFLFTDDDVIVNPFWVAHAESAFADSSIDGVGGKILPKWEGSVPTWFSAYLYPNLALIDYGDVAFDINSDKPYYGANMAFRRRVFNEIGDFRIDLGRRGDMLLGNEDTEFCKRALTKGYRLVYDPHMIVNHIISSNRLTKSYFHEYHFRMGETMVLSGRDAGKGYAKVLRIPLWRIKEYMTALLLFIFYFITFRPKQTIIYETKLCEALGYIKGTYQEKEMPRANS